VGRSDHLGVVAKCLTHWTALRTIIGILTNFCCSSCRSNYQARVVHWERYNCRSIARSSQAVLRQIVAAQSSYAHVLCINVSLVEMLQLAALYPRSVSRPVRIPDRHGLWQVFFSYMLNKGSFPTKPPDVPESMEPRSKMNIARTFILELFTRSAAKCCGNVCL